MNKDYILAKARAIKNEREKEAEKKRLAYETESARRKREEKENFDKIWKAIKDIDGQDFKVQKIDGGNIDEIATIHQYITFGKGKTKTQQESYIGTVCVQNDRYTFRGSDESPEQECVDTCLKFKKILNNPAEMICLNVNSGIDKILPHFCEQLANVLAEKLIENA